MTKQLLQYVSSYKTCLLTLFICMHSFWSIADNWIHAYAGLNKPNYGFVSKVFSDDQIVYGGHNSSDEVILFRADANGVIKASKKIENCSKLKVILETQDKHIFISGITFNSSNQGSNIFWMKLDMNLNIIWTFQNSRSFNDIVESAIQHSNGSYYLVGYGSRSGNELSDRDALIYNINGDGNIISSKISNNFGTDYFNSILELPDGNIVTAGAKLWQVAMDFYIVKYSPNLSTIVSRTYGGVDNEGAYDLELNGGSLYVLGGTYSFGAGLYDALLSKLDFDINLLFTKSYGLSSDEFPTSLVAINNQLIIAGNLDTILVPDSTTVPAKAFFIRIDLDGNFINGKILDRQSTIYSINAIGATSKDEIVGVFGSTNFTATPNTAIVIFKTDSFTFTCCDYFRDITFLQSDEVVITRTQTFNFNNAGLLKSLTSSTLNYSLDKIKSCGPLNDTAKINLENRPYCISELIKLTVSTSVIPNSFTWIMGDSISNSITEPELTFDTAGTYFIYYIANFDCNSDTDTVKINIVKEIPYQVVLNRDGLCIGSAISFFVESSTTFITQYKWDFGISSTDSDTSNLENPSFIFTEAGTYKVKLFSKSACGSKVDSITINIAASNKSSIEPNAITYCKNAVVPFVFDADATAIAVLWNFGDTGSPTNTSSNLSENHVYTKPGNYVCTLITTFECNSDTDTLHIYIIDYYPVNASIESIGFCSSEPFSFDIQHSLSNATYQWDIRGPTNYTFYTKNFDQLFTKAGNYTVYASVSDNNCNKGLDTLELFVSPFVEANIEIISDPCLLSTQFKSLNASEQLLWKFSDGYTSSDEIINHSFSTTGNYTVTLITNPNSTCADSTSENITIIKENLNGGIYYPEIISPNNDGQNDLFYIENTTNNPCKIEELKIFDRWGKIMHSSNKNGTFDWNGKHNGTAVIPGAYVCFIKTNETTISFILHVVY
jgi:gliding motility-associated-like protein